jgi:putative ABC transport system permease protein
MNLAALSFAYLRARRLATALNMLLLALGIATITVLLLTTRQIEARMQRDARGIDLVAGAKGSPMQLILSSVYHIDVPTGNIPLAAAQALAADRAVKRSIPLALGDAYHGFRIVGSTHDYPALYDAQPAAGRLWKAPMEAVIGADVARETGLSVGARFVGAHGLAAGGDDHEQEPYAVVGVLVRSGTVIDRLVLTSIESVWEVHQHGAAAKDAEKQITALLIQYASPLSAATVPRRVNASSALQAASPAYESARLFRMIGVGTEVLRAFGLVLVLAAGLSVFIALTNALEERRHDLAVMRMLGMSRMRLLGLLVIEALLLSAVGALAGLALGHALTEILGAALANAGQGRVTGLVWMVEEFWLLAFALGVGGVAALVPAWRAYRSDVAPVLAKG